MLVEIYGPKINFSAQYYECYKDLLMIIRSFDESGDLKLNDELSAVLYSEIEILPKAYRTLSEFEIEMAKHEDLIKISKWQRLFTFFMLMVALANLYVIYGQSQT